MAAVRELADLAASVRDTWPDLDAGLLAQLLESTPERRIGFELLCVTVRIDELADVVPRTLEDMLGHSGLARGERNERDPIGIALLGLALGSAGHTRVDGSLQADASSIARWLHTGSEHVWQSPASILRTQPLESFVTQRADTTLSETELRRPRLMDAAVSVIARTGVRRANLRRISRAAGYSHSAVYEEYDSMRALLLDLLRMFKQRRLATTDERREFMDPDLEGAWLSGLLSPTAHTLRRLSFELLVIASHDEEFRAVFAETDRDLIEAIATLVAGEATSARSIVSRHRYIRRDLAFGLAAIEECVGGLAALDWRPVVGGLLLGCLQDAGIPTSA